MAKQLMVVHIKLLNMKRMGYMYLSFVAFSAYILFCACNGNVRNGEVRSETEAVSEGMAEQSLPVDVPQEDTKEKKKVAEKEVLSRVKEIYDNICKPYNNNDTEMVGWVEWVRHYGSSSFNKEVQALLRMEEKHPGEMGLWSYDFWIQGQDWSHLSYRDVKIVRWMDDGRVEVQLVLHNMKDHPIGLTLIKEEGVWQIDDLRDEANPQGIRKTQAEYMSEL